nr:uncharacterized protein LOC109184715 [Ipomoea trifida]
MAAGKSVVTNCLLFCNFNLLQQPAITTWTEEDVKQRIKSEILSGQFGRGKIIPRFQRKEEQVPEQIAENVRDDLSDESLRKVTSVLRKMTGTVVEFAEVMAKIGNTRTGVESSRRLKKLFEYAGYYLSRDTFQSMRAGELESILVDIWCQRLNQLDLNRGVDKPKRIFFSTQAFLQLDSPSNWTNDDDPANSSNQIDFEQCLDTEISNVANLGISDAQLIFFSIYWHNHFYVMCYNFTTSMLEIIDNMPFPKGLKIQQKYGDSLKVLIIMMPVNKHKAKVIKKAQEYFVGKKL